MRRKRIGRLASIARGALTTLSLVGAVYAAEQVTAPPGDELTKTITDQKIREGKPASAGQDPEHQADTLAPDQMIELVARYDSESKVAYDHAETTRFAAYRSHDIIRMTCIDDKLMQMKEVMSGAAARKLAFPRLVSEDLKMRQHFLVLQMARNRVVELAAEVEACMGDVLDAITTGRIREETPSSDTILDPTRPPSPTHDAERPAEASPYR